VRYGSIVWYIDSISDCISDCIMVIVLIV